MKKYIIFISGITFIALGTSVCNLTGLGVDPFNALTIAISNYTNVQLEQFYC